MVEIYRISRVRLVAYGLWMLAVFAFIAGIPLATDWTSDYSTGHVLGALALVLLGASPLLYWVWLYPHEIVLRDDGWCEFRRLLGCISMRVSEITRICSEQEKPVYIYDIWGSVRVNGIADFREFFFRLLDLNPAIKLVGDDLGPLEERARAARRRRWRW